MESEGNIFCWKCGALNLEKHNFCVKCGHSLYSETKKPESKFEKNKPRRKNDYLKNNGVGMKKKLHKYTKKTQMERGFCFMV